MRANKSDRAWELGLSVVVVLQCLGAARLVVAEGAAFTQALWFYGILPESSLRTCESTAAAAVAAIGLIVAIYRGPRRRLFAGSLAAWFFADSMSRVVLGGHFGAELALFAHAVRIAVPLVIAWPLSWSARQSVLRWSVASVFAAHGAQALAGNPQFVDFLLLVPREFAGWTLAEDQATSILFVIGALDVLVAAILIARPKVQVMAWAAFWGILTAWVRLAYFGLEQGWGHALIRTANGGVPLLYCIVAARERIRLSSAKGRVV